MHEGKPILNVEIGAMVHRRLVYIYLLNVPSFSSRYFNKIKRTSRLGRLLALSLEDLISNYCFADIILYPVTIFSELFDVNLCPL